MQKKRIYEHCLLLVQQRIEAIDAAMRAAQGAANEETKSSAGDKYETGRAMMHLENEKLAHQRSEALKLQRTLSQIDPERPSHQVSLGSLIHTDRGLFFVAVGLGNVVVDGQSCTVISPAAPLSQAWWGSQAGDSVAFNGQTFHLTAIL